MSVTIDLPSEVEQRLRAQCPNLDAEAKEAMLVELYRQEKLSHHELSQALGLSRFETDGLLKMHNVTEDLPTNDELEAALAHMRSLTGK
ncbi:MAG TPA: UPF0175 family protein [Phycisphaerae bacterium]|nr:UPF0175 family protein [Phycisphaerae bacterium]